MSVLSETSTKCHHFANLCEICSNYCVLRAIESAPAAGDRINEYCPQQPYSTPVESCLWILSWTQSSHLSGLTLFLLPSGFSSMTVFSKETSLLDAPQGQHQYCHLCLQRPTCYSFCWHGVSIELSANTVFQMNLLSNYYLQINDSL